MHLYVVNSFNYSVVFTKYEVVLQDGYPLMNTETSIDVSIVLHIPGTASLTSTATDRLIPKNTLAAIILNSATPFYLNTNRSFLAISSESDTGTSTGRNTSTAIAAGSTAPTVILIVALIILIVL